ncbi:zinc finger SWIM domain-containing protein 6 [Platysternon megacephalum]|uniref:Zinc finger SWIM domain-containing protein 6 n=1 Tax=Platysternon megacephalum TaxID=55544 RepID=A0A4D9F8Q3_9SAUR|nr:zinc finger SWIM domain-containing protein 6 [Platysternon megacephalum]
MNGACNSLTIARTKLRNVRLLKAEAFTSTNFTHLYHFEMHYKNKIRAAVLKYNNFFLNGFSEVLQNKKNSKIFSQGGNIYSLMKTATQTVHKIGLVLPFKILPFRKISSYVS